MWELIRENRRKSTALIVLMALVLCALGFCIGAAVDSQGGGFFGLVIALGIWAVMLLTSLTGGESLLLAAAGAREVSHEQAPQLYNVVEEMKIASGLPKVPRVFIMDHPAPNAFAVGITPERAAVAVTSGLLGRLSRDELQGVVAHEMGHIANRDTLFMTLAGVTMGAVILLSEGFLRGMRFGGYGGRRRSSDRGGGQAAALFAILAVVLALLAPLMAQLLYFACSRRREYLADASAAQFTRFPEGLASALERIAGAPGPQMEISRAVAPMFIVNPLAAAGSAANVFSTHPPTQDRVRVLRAMGGGASLRDYETAYRGLHSDQALIGARTLRGLDPAPAVAREASAPDDKGAGAQTSAWREGRDVAHRAEGYRFVNCECGVRLKVPPDFPAKTAACPRCGTEHAL